MNAAATGGAGWWKRVNRWLSPGAGLESGTDDRACARCGYAFPGGTSGAARPCIECGAALDPALPGTLVAPGPGGLGRWLMHAPGLWYQVAVLAGCGLVFVSDMAPGGWFGPLALGSTWLLVLGLFGITRLLVATALAIRWKRLRAVDAQPGWWLPPAMVAALVGLLLLGVARDTGFLIQRSRLDAARAAWEALPPEERAKGVPRTVELWTPSGLRAAGDGRFALTARGLDPAEGFGIPVPGTGFLFDVGSYYYLPRMPVAGAATAGLRPMGDGWYEATFDAMD